MTTSRVRFPKTNTTGSVPASIAPGSFAINLTDKKIHGGSSGGLPVLLSQRVENFTPAKLYRQGDICIQNSSLNRALFDIAPGTAFRQEDWEKLSSPILEAALEPAATSIISGGSVALSGVSAVSVSAGSGVVVDNTEVPAAVADVSWSSFSVTPSYFGQPWSVLSISPAGALQQIGLTDLTDNYRRGGILLAFILWDDAPSIVSVLNGSTPGGGTAELVRDQYYANGGAYRVSGGSPAATVGTFSLSLSACVVFSAGGFWRSTPDRPNTRGFAAIPTLLLSRTTRDSVVATGQTSGDPTQWDNAGTLAAVPAGEFTIQYLSALSDFSSFFLQYGRATYTTQQAAIDALSADYEASTLLTGRDIPSFLIGAVICRSGAADYDDARIINAAPGPNPFASFGGETDTTDFFLSDGTRAMTGDLDLGGNAILNADIDGGVYA